MKHALVLALAAAACSAQIVVIDPTTNALLPEMVLLPNAPANDYATKSIAIENTGSAPVTVNSAMVTGLGFSLCCVSAFTLAPQQTETVTLEFSPPTPGNFTGALEIDDLTFFLYAASIPADSLFLHTPAGQTQAHAGTPLILALDSTFTGQIPCVIQNNTAVPVIVHALSASGDWALQNPPALPLTLQAGASASFTLTSTGNLQNGLEGVISVDQWSYAIDAHAQTPAIQLALSSPTLESGQQATLSLSFASAPASTATGTVTLSFDSATSVAVSDPGILFPSTGTTTATFTSAAGQTAASFGGNDSVTFQTGTTAGTLHIHAVWGYSEDDVDVTLVAGPITIDSVTAQRQSNALEIVVSAFDNTRTAGRMSFSFFDATGAFIGNPVTADFTESFYSYFFTSAYNAGGMFKMTALFPVSGNPSQVSGVQIDLSNSAGDAQTGVIQFQ